VNGTEAQLARLRGRVLPRSHNARTIAALASNPGCARRAILDAAGVDKQRIAAYAGFPAPFGQSRFALARGNAFEAQVKADGAAELLTLLRAHLDLPIPEAHYDDLSEIGGNASLDLRHARTKTLLARAATSQDDAGTMFDHPLLRLEVGGRHAFLEPDLIAFQLHGEQATSQILADLARGAGARRGVVVDSPPGAGKSTLVVRAAAELADAGQTVMVLAQTNEQVDDLTNRLAAACPALAVGRLAATEYVPAGRVTRHQNVTLSTRPADLTGCPVVLSTAHK
jgi:hypothetical protein